MKSRWACAAAVVLSIVCAGPAGAELVRTCLPQNDAGTGLSLQVDDQGIVHLSRLFRVLGDLTYTTVDPIGETRNEPVAGFISLLATDEVNHTDLLLVDGVPHICFHNARRDTFEVARRDGGDWIREQVAEGAGVGDACELYVEGGALGVVFRGEEGLYRAVRNGPDDWRIDVIDDGGIDPGHDVSLGRVGGRLVAVHRDDGLGDLRISWALPGGGWVTDAAPQPNPAALEPRVVDDGAGGIFVMHGVQNPEASDGGMMLTTGVQGDVLSVAFELDEVGGSNAMLRDGERVLMVTRERRRSAIFGAYDGLRFYTGLPDDSAHEYLEEWGGGQRRHDFVFIDLALDPFGNVVVAMLVEAAPDGGDLGSGLVCIVRETDRDADRLPDVDEALYGSDPDVADSDGDGVIDGEEVLAGQDPAGPGALPEPEPDPDAGPDPEPDAGLEPEPDASPEPLPDAEVPDSSVPVPDAGPDPGPDADVEPEPDAAAEPEPDAAAEPEPDAAPEPEPDATAEPEPDSDAATEPEPMPDRGFALDGGPAADGGPGTTGGDGGCRATPGRAPTPAIGLGLLLLALARRR